MTTDEAKQYFDSLMANSRSITVSSEEAFQVLFNSDGFPEDSGKNYFHIAYEGYLTKIHLHHTHGKYHMSLSGSYDYYDEDGTLIRKGCSWRCHTKMT